MKRVLVVLVCIVGSALAAYMLFSTLFAAFIGGFVGAAIGAAVGVMVADGMSSDNPPASSAPRTSTPTYGPRAVPSSKTDTQAQPVPEADNLQLKLIALNLWIRTEGITGEVLASFEGAIDRLIELLPKMEETMVGVGLHVSAKRMVTDYLPQLAANYSGLKPAEREAKKADVLERLQELNSTLQQIDDAIANDRQGEYENFSTFISRKFPTSSEPSTSL